MKAQDARSLGLARWSVAVGLGVFGIKWLAWELTGSVAIYSDALESIVNIVAAVGALVALAVAVRPADATHPFGHTKAEYFSAVAEGALILFAAFEMLRAAWTRFLNPQPFTEPALGLGLVALAGAITAGWAFLLLAQGRRVRSPALVADAQHLLTDVASTVGVLFGAGLAWRLGWWWLDPLVAAGVALNILVVGLRLVRRSVGGLMDEALPPDQVERIQRTIAANLDGALEYHDLRTRASGPRAFVEFHLVVPAAMTVEEAHAITDRLERALAEALPGAETVIHVEPESEAKHGGFRA
ncbi:cation diffusion facilitator family transporter [Oceanithermus desulfurans]